MATFKNIVFQMNDLESFRKFKSKLASDGLTMKQFFLKMIQNYIEE